MNTEFFNITSKNNFDSYMKQNGFLYISARLLMFNLDYTNWKSFTKAINKAIAVCTAIGINVIDNFKHIINDNNEADYHLSKFASYLVCMNADISKPAVAKAQAFFAQSAELVTNFINSSKNLERIITREELSEKYKLLNSTIKNHGIENYAAFHNKGYLGLYNMNLNDLLKKKNIDRKDFINCMDSEELAANLFRTTQTESKIKKENLYGQNVLEDTAYEVGKEVRSAMERISGNKPEDLPLTTDIKLIKKEAKSTHKLLNKTKKSRKINQIKYTKDSKE